MHFWQLFHPLRALSSSVPLVGLPSRLSRLPRSRSNPFVSLTPIPEQSPSDTDLLPHCVSELSAERWLPGFDGDSGSRLRAEIHRGEPDEDSKGRSTTSDDTYEKLMLSDSEIHPRAFHSRVRWWLPGICAIG